MRTKVEAYDSSGNEEIALNRLPPQVANALRPYDTDQDGRLTGKELSEVAELLELHRNGTLRVDMFPKNLRPMLEALDDEGNGLLEVDEITEMVNQYSALKEDEKSGSISIARLPKELRKPLDAFDVDGDGTVAPLELIRGAEMYQASKKKAKKLAKMVVGLSVVIMVLLGAISGITFAMVELAKETSVKDDGITLTKDGDSVMKTGTAAFGSGMSSMLPNSAFETLTSFKVSSESAYISLNVNGYVRMGDEMMGGDVILVTHFGLVTVSGSKLSFEDVIGDVFSRAGFDVAPAGAGRRRLTGFYELQAMFNDVTSWEAADGSALGDDFVAPRFPDNYQVDVSVLYRCDTTFKIPGRIAKGLGNTEDKAVRRDYIMYDGRRCHYPGTQRSTVTVGGQEFQKVKAHMTISNELQLAREVYYPAALSDRHAIVRLKNATHNSVRYMLDFQTEGRAAIAAGTESRGLFCDASGILDEADVSFAGNPNLKFLYAGDTALSSSAPDSIGLIEDVRMFKVEDAESGVTVARLYDKRKSSGDYEPLRMEVHNGMDDIIFEFGEFQSIDPADVQTLATGPSMCLNDTDTTAWGSETRAVAAEEKTLSYYPFRGYSALFEFGGTEEISRTDAYQIYRLRTGKNMSSFVQHKVTKRNKHLVEKANSLVEENKTTGVGGDQPGQTLFLYANHQNTTARVNDTALHRAARHLHGASAGGTVALTDPEEISALAAAIQADAEAGHLTSRAGDRRLQGFGIDFDYKLDTPTIPFTHCKARVQHEISLEVNLGVINVNVDIEIGDMWTSPFLKLQNDFDEFGDVFNEGALPGIVDVMQAAQWEFIATLGMVWDMFAWGWFDEPWVMILITVLHPFGGTALLEMLGVISAAYTQGVTDLRQYIIDERESLDAGTASKYSADAVDAVNKVTSLGGPVIKTFLNGACRALISIFHFVKMPTLEVGKPFSRACSIAVQPTVEGFFGIIAVGGVVQFDANPYVDPATMFDAFTGDGDAQVENAGWEVEGCVVAELDPLGPAKNLPVIGEWLEDRLESSVELNLCVAMGVDDGTVMKENEMWNDEYFPDELKDDLSYTKDNGDTGYCPGLARPYIQGTIAMPWDFDLSFFGVEIFSLKMNIQGTLNYFFVADKRCSKWLCDAKYEEVWLAIEDKKDEANDMITTVTVDLTNEANMARAKADEAEAKANGMKQIVAAGEWVKNMLDQGLDLLGLDWDDFEVDFYKMDSFTIKAVALGARFALEALATILETEQSILEKAGGAVDQCQSGQLMDCLGTALDVGMELAEIASILTMEMDCDRYAKQKALGFDPGASDDDADLSVLDQGLFGLDWLPFTPRQIIDELEKTLRLFLEPALNSCIGPEITNEINIIKNLAHAEASLTFKMCLVHGEEDFLLDRSRLASLFEIMNELNPFDDIWDAVKDYVNGLARDTFDSFTGWVRSNTPDWCLFGECLRDLMTNILDSIPYRDPIQRKLMAEQHPETGHATFTPVENSGPVSSDVEHVLRHAHRRMAETGSTPHLHDILYAAHQFHGMDYDYHAVHTKLEEATMTALDKEVKRRVMAEDGDFASLDSFFLVEDFNIAVTATTLLEFKIVANGFGVKTGDIMMDEYQSNELFGFEKEIPIVTAVSAKVTLLVELFMPYTFAIFTGDETVFTVRASWRDAFLKINLMTGQLSGDLGTMEDTGVFYEGTIVTHAMQDIYLSLTAGVGICAATLCFEIKAESVLPKLSIGASGLIAQAGTVYPGVINSFQPLSGNYEYSSFDIQKIIDIDANGDGVLAVGVWATVSWPEFELKLTIPEELLAMSASLPLMTYGLVPDIVLLASLFGILKGTTIRLIALRDSKLYFGWKEIADFEDLVENWFGSEYDYGIGAYISGTNILQATLMFETRVFTSSAEDGRLTKEIPAFPDFTLPALYNKDRGDPTDLDFEFGAVDDEGESADESADVKHRHLQQMRDLKQLVTFEDDLPEAVQQKLNELRGVAEPAPALQEDAWFSAEGCNVCEGCKSMSGEALALTGGKDGHPDSRCIKTAGGQLEVYSLKSERRADGRYESTFRLRGGAENRFCRLQGTRVVCDATNFASSTKFSLQDRGSGNVYMKIWDPTDDFDYNPDTAKNDYITGVEHTANWWGSLDDMGWSVCGNDRVMAGFFRSGCNKLGCIEEGKCANIRNPSGDWEKADAGYAMGTNGWHVCPEGKFMYGFYRNRRCTETCKWWGCSTECDDDMSNLEKMRCVGVENVDSYSRCYEEHDVSNGGGEFLCQHGYGLAGFERKYDLFKGKIDRIDKFKCCKIETIDPAPSYCAPQDNGELYCGLSTPPSTTAVLASMDGASNVLSMGGVNNVHEPGTVCGLASNGGARCNFQGPNDIDRQLYVAGDCNNPSKFTIDAPSGGFGPLLLDDGSEDTDNMMCIDCDSEQACHAAKRGTASCTEFAVDVPGGEAFDDSLKHRLVTKDGMCLDCPWQTVYKAGSTFMFRDDQGYGGDRECRLNNCYRDIARFAVGMTFKQRQDKFAGTDAGTPEPNRLCSTADGAGALYGECKSYAEKCEKYEVHHAYCEAKKVTFIEDVLKPTIAKVASHWEKLSVEADANLAAAEADRNHAHDTDVKLANQQAFLVDSVSTLNELIASVNTRYENCLVLNYPKALLVTFDFTFRFCIIGFCFEKDPVRIPFVVPMGDDTEDLSERSGGGSESVEKYIDDLLYGLHEAGQDEPGMQEILDATFNFDDIDNTMPSVYHESDCFDVATKDFGEKTLDLLQADCEIDEGQALNRFGVKLDEDQCGTGRGVVWWSCVNALKDAPGVCSWHSHNLGAGGFNGKMSEFMFDMSCPEGTLVSRIAGSTAGRKVDYQCCNAVVQYQGDPANCVTVEPGWPGGACSASNPVGSSTSLATFGMYDPKCDREPSMLDWQKTGGRVAMTSYTAEQVNCGSGAGMSLKVSVTCCKVLSSRSAGFDKVRNLDSIEFRFTVYVQHVRLFGALGEWGDEDIFFNWNRNGGTGYRVDMPLIVDVDTDYFPWQPLVKNGSPYSTFKETDKFAIDMWEEDNRNNDHVAYKEFKIKDVANKCTDENRKTGNDCCGEGQYGRFCVMAVPEIQGLRKRHAALSA